MNSYFPFTPESQTRKVLEWKSYATTDFSAEEAADPLQSSLNSMWPDIETIVDTLNTSPLNRLDIRINTEDDTLATGPTYFDEYAPLYSPKRSRSGSYDKLLFYRSIQNNYDDEQPYATTEIPIGPDFQATLPDLMDSNHMEPLPTLDIPCVLCHPPPSHPINGPVLLWDPDHDGPDIDELLAPINSTSDMERVLTLAQITRSSPHPVPLTPRQIVSVRTESGSSPQGPPPPSTLSPVTEPLSAGLEDIFRGLDVPSGFEDISLHLTAPDGTHDTGTDHGMEEEDGGDDSYPSTPTWIRLENILCPHCLGHAPLCNITLALSIWSNFMSSSRDWSSTPPENHTQGQHHPPPHPLLRLCTDLLASRRDSPPPIPPSRVSPPPSLVRDGWQTLISPSQWDMAIRRMCDNIWREDDVRAFKQQIYWIDQDFHVLANALQRSSMAVIQFYYQYVLGSLRERIHHECGIYMYIRYPYHCM